MFKDALRTEAQGHFLELGDCALRNVHDMRRGLRGRTEPMMRLDGVDAERRADVPRCQHPSCGLDHAVVLIFRERHSFVRDAVDLKCALEQLGKELLRCHRIVGDMVVLLRVPMEFDPVFDFVFR